ncbi:hypothetical protein [Sphingomonas sp. R86521]|uniref:hypothetical protein n=1 Tax=Sphingomonas sp. R86521 TaxID=3093860 RepID=UPI0036D357B5
MLKTQIKRRAAEGAGAVRQLAEIRAAIAGLVDDDLLDLADIFSGETQTWLGEVATTEVRRRNLSL